MSIYKAPLDDLRFALYDVLDAEAHCAKLGFAEVNRSNNSKFGEDGQPILDKNLKLIKGPNYSKPDLKIFV